MNANGRSTPTTDTTLIGALILAACFLCPPAGLGWLLALVFLCPSTLFFVPLLACIGLNLVGLYLLFAGPLDGEWTVSLFGLAIIVGTLIGVLGDRPRQRTASRPPKCPQVLPQAASPSSWQESARDMALVVLLCLPALVLISLLVMDSCNISFLGALVGVAIVSALVVVPLCAVSLIRWLFRLRTFRATKVSP